MDLHIIEAADEGYASFLGISLLSVILNNQQEFDSIVIYIIDNGILAHTKKILINQLAKGRNNITIHFVEVNKKIERVCPKVPNTWPNSIYARFFIDDFIPNNVNKVLYIDADTIVRRSLLELMNTNLDGKTLAGVLDAGGNELYKKRIGLEKKDVYINSGVLLINMLKWRELNAEERLLSFVNSFPAILKYPDQDAINVVFKNDIYVLSLKYNYSCQFTELEYKYYLRKKTWLYPESEVKELVTNRHNEIVVVHFSGAAKPWYIGECKREYARDFLRYYHLAELKRPRKIRICIVIKKCLLDLPKLTIGLFMKAVMPKFVANKMQQKLKIVDYNREQ